MSLELRRVRADLILVYKIVNSAQQVNSTNHLIRERWLTRGKKLDSLYIYPRFFNKQSILTLKVLTVLE